MPNCCTDCFSDEYLKELIREDGAIGNCDFCGSKNVYIIAPEELKTFLDPLIGLYSAQVEFFPMDLLKECEGRFIWEILSEDWGVFDDSQIGKQIIEEMYGGYYEDGPSFLDHYMEREDEWYGHDEEMSDRLKKQWKEFCEEIVYRNRFFPQTKLDTELLSEVLSYSENLITANTFLFRARLSSDEKILSGEKMGMPPKQITVEGRANPKCISYLYLASDSNTAISEIRPQVHNKVTVGKFKVNSEIKVIDLRNPCIETPFKWGDKLAFVCDIFNFLRMLGSLLSKPVDKDNVAIDYLPTQYLCEFIKNQGYEGVLYKSFLGQGNNIVLFSEENVKCIGTKLHKITSVKVDSEEVV